MTNSATTATLDDLDDPAQTSARAPLTGNISTNQASSNHRAAGSAQGYLNSAIPGEDRRAPMSTIEESVWETLRRDLLGVWEKMRLVLWPKYLLGGAMTRGGGGIGGGSGAGGGEEAEELMGGSGGGLQGTMGHVRGLVGRWPDADTVLQAGMSEGLRDWDLWYVPTKKRSCCARIGWRRGQRLTLAIQGPSPLLPPALLPPQHQRARGPALARLFRRLRDHLAWRGDRHAADQTTWREHVRIPALSSESRILTSV